MELVLTRFGGEVLVPDDAEYLAEVGDILGNETVLSMEKYPQHGHTSCLAHSVAVSYLSWRSCKKLGLNARAAARGGLLHDLFLYDWHTRYKEAGDAFHGLTHPRIALENAARQFRLSEKERDIILKHMWPLTLRLPRHRESFVVLFYDKICSARETLRRPLF